MSYLLLWPVPINPVSWDSPDPPSMRGIYEKNDYLKNIEIFWENDGHSGPEDIAIHDDNLYVGYHDGLIMRSDGEFYNTNGRPLGMVFDAGNNLIVADAIQGLISINQNGIASTLSIKSDSDGIPLSFADDLDIAMGTLMAYSGKFLRQIGAWAFEHATQTSSDTFSQSAVPDKETGNA